MEGGVSVQYMPCACGNIVMSGRHAQKCDNLYITNEDLLQITKIVPSLFIVSGNGIVINRLDKASTKIIPNSEILLRCDVCHVGCKILIPREDVPQALVYEYDEQKYIQRRRMSAPNFNRPMSMFFPPHLKPFVTQTQTTLPDSVESPEKKREEEEAENPVDIDAMFANEPDNDIVGCYVPPVFF